LQAECHGCELGQDEVKLVSTLKEWIHVPHKYGEQLRLLQSGNLDIFSENSSVINPENLLRMIGEEQKFEISFRHSSKPSNSNNHTCLIEMSTSPNSTCIGISKESFIDAQKDACRNALEYLRMAAQ